MDAALKDDCCRGLALNLETGLFKALCDPSRVALLSRLIEAGAPLTVSGIAARFPTDISVVSRHLAVLRDAGVLAAERRGREVFYSVRYRGLADTLRRMADAVDACCPAEPTPKEEYSHEQG